MLQRFVGPLAEIPRQIYLKFLEKLFLTFLNFSSFKFKIGCVDTIVFNSFSVKIFADVTILSFFLNKGY